jgi:hypothetical protein
MLEVQNVGNGFIGTIAGDWSIQYPSTPMVVGVDTGRLGVVNFGAECDETSRFSIDNYASVKHFFDDQTTRWLSTFDGNIRGLNTDVSFGRFGIVSLAAGLDGTRTSKANPSGTYQRSIRLPSQVSYVANSVTYYTGGFYATVDGVSVWNPRPIEIYDVASEKNYIYVLASGGHSGEVVFQIGIDGTFRSVWPVWSDATDLASPQGRHITYADGYVWIGQVAADRIKRFHNNGTFISQWGSAGTGNGQFDTISDVESNGYGLNAVYVTDSALGRVQYFTDDGSYTGQWGTSGTGDGNTVFNAPNGITIEPNTNNVFVSDRNGRVREYTSTGTYVGQPMGSWTAADAQSTGEFRTGDYPISVSFDTNGNAFAIQAGTVYQFARGQTSWPTIASLGKVRAVSQFIVRNTGGGTAPKKISIDRNCGIIHVPRQFDYVEQYTGSLGCIQAYILYYVALGKEDMSVRIMALNEPWATNELAFIPWSGNVWRMLGDMCAATETAMVMLDGSLIFINRAASSFTLPDDFQPSSLEYDSRSAGHDVVAVNYNARRTIGEEIMYNSEFDDRHITVKQDEVTYVTLEQECYPEYLRNPTPGTVASPGVYVVTDEEGDVVTPSVWTEAGGKITVTNGERPGQILVAVHGPTRLLVGFTAPYSIADAEGASSLSIMGQGILAKQETITVGTGAPAGVTGREVAVAIDSPFCFNSKITYTEASWAAYVSSSPMQRVSFTFSALRSPGYQNNAFGIGGTALLTNSIVQYKDAQYVVESVDANSSTITLKCYRYTKTARNPATGDYAEPRLDDLWEGKTAAEFDAYWAGYTAQDVTIAPLRFGLTLTTPVLNPPLAGGSGGYGIMPYGTGPYGL